jgi:hypothetical protein
MSVTERSDRKPPQRRRNLTTWSNRTVEQVFALLNWTVLDQGGLYGAAGPASAPGLCLVRPAGRTPGHTAQTRQVGIAHLARQADARNQAAGAAGVTPGPCQHPAGDTPAGHDYLRVSPTPDAAA